MEIKTKDLWQSAYVLAEGGKLTEVELVSRAGKKEVIFVFRGEELGELVQSFQTGSALCNVLQLKASMNHLKDLIFSQVEEVASRK